MILQTCRCCIPCLSFACARQTEPSLLQVELGAYMGADVIKATLCDKMPDAMRKDVEKLLEAQTGQPLKKPERFTRTEQAARAARAESATGAAEGAGGAGPSGGPAAAAQAEAEPEVSPCGS